MMMSSAGSDLMSNPEIANNQIMAVCITMNKAKSNCTECDKNDYVGLIPEDGDETPEEYAERLYQHCKTAELDCWHEVLRNKMTVKEAMLGNLKINEPKTVAGCELKMATLVEVTGNPEELSGDAQDEVASQSKYCVLLLVNTDQKLDITTTENTANSALSTAGSAMISAHQNQKDEQEEQLGIASQSEAHAEVRRRRKKRSSGLTAQETQMDLLKTVDSIGSIVGSSKAAGESPSKFSTPVMNLAVNKAWGDKASNVPADDGNGFNLPSSDSLFPDANDTSQLIMSSQVVSQPSNPFVGKNDSSNDTLSINSAVVMLSLTNSTGGNIDLGNLTKPTHVFIKRDRNDVSIERIVQKAGEYENDGDRTPFIIHKVKVPAASSLHIRVVQTWQFNTTNCSAINLTMADNETMEYCNWTSTLETAPQPTWLDVSTSKPTTVSTQFFTTTLADVLTTTNTRAIMTDNHTRSSTSFGSTNSGADRTSTSVPSTTTTASVPGSTSTQASQSTGAILGGETTILSFDVTPNWIQESTNKTGWILYIGQGSRPSLSRPESYITCELPFLNDQIKLLQRDIRMNQVDQNNASTVLNNTDIPDWLWNLPANLEKDLDTCFFSNSFFDSAVEMDVYIGIKYLPPANVSSTSNVSDWLESTTPAPMRKRREAAANETDLTSQMEELVQDVLYQLEFYTAQCKIWNHYIQDWETEGCEVGPYSSPTNTHCICTKLTRDPPDDWVPPLPRIDPISGEEIPPASAPPMSFGAALAVPTNEIDLSGAAFANLGENPLVFSFMVSLMCLYLCLCIWARAADIKDEIKSSTSPLLDNDPRDKYFYELIVYTGSTSGSGTTAKVSMIFSGDEDETPPRLIFDDKKKVLEKGGIDSFIMAVPQSLGSLNVCRVWHDNSGKNPSWNFSRVQVTDLQTNEKFFFVLDRWLAVDQDDGCIDRVIPVAGKEELTNFNLVFWNKARRDITDGHIWFSVFGRPHRSRFTRIQRLTCCLSLLFCTMFANILFYQGDEAQSSSSPPIKIGPISLTLQMLLTGIYASLIVFPINLIIVMVFRYSGDRPKRLPTAVREKKKNDEKMLSQSTLELRQQAEYLTSGDDNNRLLTNLNTTAVDDWGAPNKKQKKKFMLPWWFIIVGYLMCLGSIIWCFISVVGVAFNFGPTKAAEWLTSFCLSFLESVLCTQPLKVLGLAAFYALVIKSPAVEDEDERDPELQKDEVYVHEHKRAKDIHNPRFRRRLKKFTRIPLPPSEEYLKAARLLRHKEVKMMDLLKEMALYLIFIYLLLMVGYGNRDPWAHHFYKNVKNLAAHGIWSPNNMGYDISNVKDPGTFYRWLEDTLVASYYSTEVYDGERHWWTTNFSADYNSVPAGKPRLRLLRTKDYECNMPVYLYEKRCSRPYSMSGEDKESYKAGWVPLNHTDTELMYPDEGFTYNTSLSLFGFPTSGDTATYGGGGYVFDLSHIQSKTYERIQYLKDIEWIDPQTRAVFVEFNLYNSAVNLFAVSYILFEFLPTGSIIPSFKVQIFRLDRYIGAQALTTMVAEILMTLYIIYYLVREIKSIRKLKREYFKSLWNVFEIAVLIASMFSFILYFIRLYICLTTMKRFRSDKTAFHNFQLAAGIDQLYGFFMAFILFASTIKFTKLLRFNKRIMTLAISMVAIFKPLAGFGVMFGISFFAFAQMAYMIFVNNLLAFSTFGASIGTLLSMMLNKFDYPVLERANPVFAPIIFLAFVGMMTMLMVNFLLTIIIDTYTEVKSELMQQENEYELIEFITGKIKGLVGRAPPPKLPKMRNEGDGFVDDKQVELSSRVEELMDKFMEIVTSDPQQRRLADEIEQKRKFLKNGVGVKRKIVTG